MIEELLKVISTQLKLQKESNNSNLSNGKKVILELIEINKKYDEIIKNQEKILRIFEHSQIVEAHKF